MRSAFIDYRQVVTLSLSIRIRLFSFIAVMIQDSNSRSQVQIICNFALFGTGIEKVQRRNFLNCLSLDES